VKEHFLTKLNGMQEMPTQEEGEMVNKQEAGIADCVKKALVVK
jgi:hypothetical protein